VQKRYPQVVLLQPSLVHFQILSRVLVGRPCRIQVLSGFRDLPARGLRSTVGTGA